jgi:hypothetical protein
LRFALSKPANVSLMVYDVSGRLVGTLVDEKLAAQMDGLSQIFGQRGTI